MTQYIDTGFETERFYECMDCKEAISNPICPACLTTQIEAWLATYPDRNKILARIKNYVEKTNNLTGKTTQCISCGKKRASLCPYCFTEYVLNELKRIHVNRLILKEFMQFFNYDFEHAGYSKEAERLGVI